MYKIYTLETIEQYNINMKQYNKIKGDLNKWGSTPYSCIEMNVFEMLY